MTRIHMLSVMMTGGHYKGRFSGFVYCYGRYRCRLGNRVIITLSIGMQNQHADSINTLTHFTCCSPGHLLRLAPIVSNQTILVQSIVTDHPPFNPSPRFQTISRPKVSKPRTRHMTAHSNTPPGHLHYSDQLPARSRSQKTFNRLFPRRNASAHQRSLCSSPSEHQ